MACSIYNIDSDKLFLCCNDVEVLQVYEIDSLYLAPVQQKHWTEVATVNFGEGREYKAIKIGNKEIIEGYDLERLMRELLSLGMMVNCEGLCFLKQESSIVESVNYYRMFDKFDWSKYDVKVRVSTRWICSDIVTGRPMLDCFMQMMFEKVSQFAEAKDLHRSECMELKLKHLALVEQKSEDKPKVKEDELQVIKALETLAEVVESKRIRYPSQNVKLPLSVQFPIEHTPFFVPDIFIAINDMNALVALPSFPGLICQSSPLKPRMDTDNWWVVRVIRVRQLSKTSNVDTLIYYDGKHSIIDIPSARHIPFPLRFIRLTRVRSGMFFYLAGVGVRYGFSVEDAVWEREIV